MENEQLSARQDPDPKDLSKKPITNEEATAFENPSTDPGFEPSYLEPEEEEKEENEKPGVGLDDKDTDVI